MTDSRRSRIKPPPNDRGAVSFRWLFGHFAVSGKPSWPAIFVVGMVLASAIVITWILSR